jgi:hypothetical protein
LPATYQNNAGIIGAAMLATLEKWFREYFLLYKINMISFLNVAKPKLFS